MKTPISGVLMTLLWSPRELDSSGSSLPAYPHADFGALGREEQFLLGGQTVACVGTTLRAKAQASRRAEVEIWHVARNRAGSSYLTREVPHG